MTTINLEPDLVRDEGERTHAYKDSRGIWTIGIGHNIQADPSLMPQLAHLIHDGIDQATIDALFAHDVQGAKLNLTVHLPWWTMLDDVRQDALVNLTFNLGIGRLLGFPHTLASLQAHDYAGAAANLRSSRPWIDQVGQRGVRISEQIRTGVHQT